MSNSPGLVDFAVGPVDFILHLLNRQVKVLGECFEEINLIHHICKNFLGASDNYFHVSTSWLQLG